VRVFKFGGASIESVDRAKKVCEIIKKTQGEPMVIVISAMGKTTNALEKIVSYFMAKETELLATSFQALKEQHDQFAAQLLGTKEHAVFEKLNELYTEIEWTLQEPEGRGYDYYYDQIVSVGELMSTSIISSYLNNQNIDNEWVDARDLIRTDDTYRDGKVDWPLTSKKIKIALEPLLAKNKTILSQGFIGATDENNSTTLGREGSDYTAAIFGAILNADDVTIWKDVPALLNADPKEFKDTVAINNISYREVIEMAFYGAQVIHPKTIKPLHNNSIPLHVKCFLDDTLPGTTIQKQEDYIQYPPMLVWKKNQVLIELSTLDFSFINEGNLAIIYNVFHEERVKLNIIQNAAIGFAACVDNKIDKIAAIIGRLSEDFKVKHSEGVDLLTIRHYTEDTDKPFVKDRTILLKQQTRTTLKYVLK
jgi:aspartate kinase